MENTKIIAIGDIHGSDIWKTVIEQPYDKLVFIGDYFDTFEGISVAEQIYNFEAIIALKKSTPDKVVILLGNHDYHYFAVTDEKYSGFDPVMKLHLQDRVWQYLSQGLIQIAFTQGNYLFTHAGVTNTWYDKLFSEQTDKDSLEIAASNLNKLAHTTTAPLGFNYGYNGSMYGDDVTHGPLWVRPKSLRTDKLVLKNSQNIVQIIGHTPQSGLVIKNGLCFIDTIYENTIEYLLIQNNELKPIKLNG